MVREDTTVGKIEQLTNIQPTVFLPQPNITLTTQQRHIMDAVNMAAKVVAGRDFRTLSMREHDLVKYLFRAGLLKKENDNGFVGEAI